MHLITYAEINKFYIIIIAIYTITKNSVFRVGFETLSYTVNEGVGSQQVCVRMFEPPADTVINGNFLVAVETVADTAGE